MKELLRMILGNIALDNVGDKAVEELSDAIVNDMGAKCDRWYQRALAEGKPHPGRYVVRQFIRDVLGKMT